MKLLKTLNLYFGLLPVIINIKTPVTNDKHFLLRRLTEKSFKYYSQDA